MNITKTIEQQEKSKKQMFHKNNNTATTTDIRKYERINQSIWSSYY
jgi:hypothetical protein